MSFSPRMFPILIAAQLAVWMVPAFSQTFTTGDVVGVVTDTSGAVVPGATITIRSAATNEVRTAKSGDAGGFRFALLQPGEYTISAQTAGLKSNVQRFTLLVGQELPKDIVLNPQGTVETVEVTTQTSALETENANLTNIVNEQQVRDLPMAGGDVTTLAMTTPGIRVKTNGGSGNMNANGVPGSSMLFTLNGADIMDPYNNLNNSGPSNNTLGGNEVAEAAVVLNAFSAQFGRMAGGQENIIGKSGSNAFHGNANYNYNDALFNANSFFKNLAGTPRGRADSNLYSASLGGPVIRNKTFFFVDTEGLRYALPASTTVSIPSPQLQAYTAAHIPAASVPLYEQAFALWNGAPGLNRAVPITTGTGILQDKSGTLGCGGKGTFVGTPTGIAGETFGVNVPCAEAFVSANNQVNTDSLFIARVDQNFTDRQKLAVRFSYDWGTQATSTSPLSPTFNQISVQPTYYATVNYTFVISPTVVNNFIASAFYGLGIFGVPDFKKAQAEMPERFTIADGGAQQGGMTPLGAAYPTGRAEGIPQFIDDLSWTRGKHTFKFGINYKYDKVSDTSIASSAFEGLYTFNDLTDFATGQVNSTGKNSSFTQGYPLLATAHVRVYSVNFYAQDEWAVSKNLKLTFGLRFERNGDPSCLDNCFARFNAPFGSSGYQGGLNIPYNATIQTGLHYAYASIEPVIPEPRFGFVFSPFGSAGKKPVIRGGVGLFANFIAASAAASVFANSPEKFSPTVTFGDVATASDPNSSVAAANASFTAFESGFKQGFTLAQIQAAMGKIKFSPPGFYSTPNQFQAAKILEWNFEVEQPLTQHDVLAVTYTGNHGYDEPVLNDDANAFTLATNLYPNGYGGFPTAAPDPRFLQVNQVSTAGISNYDALIVQVRHALAKGLQGQIGYVWSHTLGTQGSGSSNILYNPYNLNANYGPLPFDTRHMVTGDMVWNTPWKFQNRFLGMVAGGWTLGAKLYIYSGAPFSVLNGNLSARINSGGGIGSSFLADVVNPSVLGTSCGSGAVTTPCLTAAEFAATTTQTDFGNTAPGMFRGPGYFDIDTQITKSFKIRERVNFGLGAQFYNLLNHPNFANPSGTVTSSSLGLISTIIGPPTSVYGTGQGATVSGRVMVVSGKFSF
jgi:hypothetical protein